MIGADTKINIHFKNGGNKNTKRDKVKTESRTDR
jgi:hypothetical protein